MIRDCSHRLLRLSEWSYSIIVLLFAFTIPLMSVPDAYWGLTFGSWLGHGLTAVLAAALACLVVCRIVNIRCRVAKAIDWKSPRNKLRLRCLCVFLIVFLVTFLLFGVFSVWLEENPQLYADSTKFDDLESFRTYMEQPIAPDGEKLTYSKTFTDSDGYSMEVYLDSYGTAYWYYTQHITETLTDTDGNTLLRYKRYNDTVSRIVYSPGADHLPIHVLTEAQCRAANDTYDLILAGWLPVFLAEAVIIILRYRKKVQFL